MKKALLLLGFIGFFQNAYSFSFGSSSFLKTRAIAITTACASLKTSGISLFKAAKTIAFEYPKTTALCLAAVATGYAVYKYFKPKSTTTATTTNNPPPAEEEAHDEELFNANGAKGNGEDDAREVPATTQPATTRTQQLASEGATEETERKPSASAPKASDAASDGAGAAETTSTIKIPSADSIEYFGGPDSFWYHSITKNALHEEATITISVSIPDTEEVREIIYLFSGTEPTKLTRDPKETPQSNCERAAEIRRLFSLNKKQDAINLLYKLKDLNCAQIITEEEALEKEENIKDIEYHQEDDDFWYDTKTCVALYKEATITITAKKTKIKQIYIFTNTIMASTIRKALLEKEYDIANSLMFQATNPYPIGGTPKKISLENAEAKKAKILISTDKTSQRKPSASTPKASEAASSGAGAASVNPKPSAEEAEKLAMAFALAKVLSTSPTAQAALAAHGVSMPSASASQPDKAGAAEAATA